MKKIVLLAGLSVFFLFGHPSRASAGTIYQNFEPENATTNGTTTVGNAMVTGVDRAEGVHLGRYAAKSTSPFYWSGMGVFPRQNLETIDLKEIDNDRLAFWAYALPDRKCYVYGCEAGTDNNVGVTFYDNNLYKTTGFEVWTTQNARYGQWSKLKVLFSQLPADFDLAHVTRLDFKNYWPGTYYIDDIHAERRDRAYQSFEIEERKGSADGEYGWKWNDADTAIISTEGEPVFEGSHSWKLISTGKWGGTGIQSQEKQLFTENAQTDQTFWHVNLSPENNDRLTFWVYGLPETGMDNNIAVQFYGFNADGTPHTDSQKTVVWTNEAARAGHWTKLTALFSDVWKQNSAFDFKNINKIQFQHYWPGTYYIDDIRATSRTLVIKETQLSQGIIAWDPMDANAVYRLQESTSGPESGWVTIYSGPSTSFSVTRLSKSWYRVRWEEKFQGANSLPYASDWSKPAAYLPETITFNYKILQSGYLTWSAIPQAQTYEAQSSPAKHGPWTTFHKGPAPQYWMPAHTGIWYRVRALKEEGGNIIDITPWSRPQTYNPGRGFVRAAGTVLKDADGTGDELVLTGTNLGGLFVIEPWMTGLGTADAPPLEDDWSIRQALASRFTPAEIDTLLRAYQESYVNAFDFDRMLDMGMTLVRVPFYYRNFQDDDGNWIRDTSGNIDFSALDRVVDALSNRGIYVVLDMHGAPGLQSADATTGRKNFNKLFASDGEIYRQRAIAMWIEIARHYKDNTWVLGYDLLNEPVGAAPNTALLADMYDRIYKAIRGIDPNHLIIMEGIWFPDPAHPENEIVDWDTLPVPADKNWSNVMYQFHFYNWGHDEDAASHEIFINRKLTAASDKQPLYHVPVMIGEFYGFNTRSIWEYYLQNFNAQKWSWTTWSYKYHGSPSTWGLVTHAYYDDEAPKFKTDPYYTLIQKLLKYETANTHTASQTLRDMITAHSLAVRPTPADKPVISGISDMFIGVYQPTLTISGKGFGDTQGTSTLDYPYGSFSVIQWSDTSIMAQLLDCVPPNSGPLTITTSRGTSNGVEIITSPRSANTTAGFIGSTVPGGFTFKGSGLGDTPGKFQFYPMPCSSSVYPPFTPCNNGDAAITFWSDTLIKGFIPPDAADTTSRYNIHAQHGGELYPTMLHSNAPPVLSAIGNKTVNEGAVLSFTVSATDLDADTLAYDAAGLPTGAAFAGQTFSWTPGFKQSGAYPITFQVTDGESTDSETITITVKNVPLPDLVLTSLLSAASITAPGRSFSISCTVRNKGGGSAGPFTIHYHLSKNTVSGDADDIAFATTSTVNSLAAGASSSLNASVTVPAATAPGKYTIFAKVDNAHTVLEENETNNSRRTDGLINITLPDLGVTSLSGPSTATRGGTIILQNSIMNMGPINATTFYIGFYLSTDETITTADRRIGRTSISNLSAGASRSANTTLTIPATLTPGTYYYGAIVDYTNTNAESNETNNALARGPAQIT